MKQLNAQIEKLQNDNRLFEFFEKIPVKNRKTKKGFLESVVILSYILYITNDDRFLIITKELSEIDFFHNYDYWTWIECAICLLAYHYQVNNNNEEFLKLKTILDNTLETAPTELALFVKKNVHQRFLKGELLDKSYIIEAIDEKNPIKEINKRLVYMMNLIKLQVYKEEASVDKNMLNNEIIENSAIIQAYFKENGFVKVFPF